MSWSDAAAAAAREEVPPAEPQLERASRAERDACLAEVEQLVRQLEPMLVQAGALMQKRIRAEKSETSDTLHFESTVDSVSLMRGEKRGVRFRRPTGWSITGLASGTPEYIVLSSRPWEPDALAALLEEARAAQEWVPVELARTLKYQGLSLPTD